jgi:chromosome partitioning protein
VNSEKNKLNNTQIISVINQKGGVGKTTTVINLATALTFQKKKILVIDLDPQGNATTGFGLSNKSSSKTIYDVLNGNCEFEEAINDTLIKNLKIVSSNVDLSGLEVETATENRRAFLLKDKIKNYINSHKNDFSYIFIDCPPSLSLLTIMALVVAKSLIVPLQAEFFALEGLSQLIKTIDRVKINLNPELSIRGVLLTMFDKRNKLSTQVDKEARKFLKEKVYETVIPRNVRLSEAPSHGIPILIYDKLCSGSRSYSNFAEEFLKQEDFMESAA